MKLISIIIALMILNSCGTKKLPTDIIKKQIDPADQDFDLLTIKEEKKIGSDPTIPDYPLLLMRLPQKSKSLTISLNYEKQNQKHSISTDDKQELEYQKFLFEQRSLLKPISSRINASIEVHQLSPFLKVDRIKNLKISLYYEKNDKKVYLLENHYIEKYDFISPIELNDISLNPAHTLNLLYDEKPLFVEVIDFTYTIPSLKKEFQYSNILQNISEHHGSLTILLNNFSELVFRAQGIKEFELLEYWNYEPFPSDTESLGNDLLTQKTHLKLIDQDRQYKAQTWRTNRIVKSLIRSNGTVDATYSQHQTDSQEYLVSTKYMKRIFQTKPHRFYISNFIISHCDANVVFHTKTNTSSISTSFLGSFLPFNKPHTMNQLAPHIWKVFSDKNLVWKATPASKNVLTGDTQKKCLKYIKGISHYLPIKSLFEEHSLNMNIIGMSRQNYK